MADDENLAVATDIVGVGYEGCDLADFVRALNGDRVSVVIDVRLTPISRKTGFSKKALARALADAGIRYEHYPALGNPKDNRPGFAGSANDLEHARQTFADAVLTTPDAQHAMNTIAEQAACERVALLCFEADTTRCHRALIIDEVRRRIRIPQSV